MRQFFCVFFFSFSLLSQLVANEKKQQGSLQLGFVPPAITLKGETGGRVSGDVWSSAELKTKMHVLFYVAPAHKDMNKKATDAIRKQNFSRSYYASVAIINMAASAWPNWIIAKKIASSQEEFPNTTYVKDVKRAFVHKWALKDDSNSVVVISGEGKVLYFFNGQLPEQEIKKMTSVMQAEMLRLQKKQTGLKSA